MCYEAEGELETVASLRGRSISLCIAFGMFLFIEQLTQPIMYSIA